MSITKRLTKGRPLTLDEMDTNMTTFDNARGVADKAAAVVLTPENNKTIFVDGTDGGHFKGVTGAAAATYSDNGGDYCGTQFIPTGGDGSAAWVRVDERVTIEMFGCVSGAADVITEMNACKDAVSEWVVPAGVWNITAENELASNAHVTIEAGAVINQLTAEKRIFYATSKDSIVIEFKGGHLYGLGTDYVNSGSNQGRYAKGIEFLGCTNSEIKYPKCKNFGSAGISIIGGDCVITNPNIEGTHAYTDVIPAGGNFQQGIYVANDTTYGLPYVTVISPEITGVAQGILRENLPTALEGGKLQVDNPYIHDIPGQHAFYIQGGQCTVTNPVMNDINYSGFKVQSADANYDMFGYSCIGAVAKNIGTSLFEIAVIGTGSISNVELSAIADNVDNYGISINGKVKNLNCKMELTQVASNAVYMFGDDIHDIDIDVTCSDSGAEGVLITATNSDGITIRPKLREPSGVAANKSGILVQSASAEVEIIKPSITDSATNMLYGIFNSTAGSTVRVKDSAEVSGASDTAIRATGIIYMPTDVSLSGTNGEYTGLNNVRANERLITKAQSTSGSNVVAFFQDLDDESAYVLTATVTGKLSGSAERQYTTIQGLFYRDAAGNATQQGATQVISVLASAGAAGVVALGVNGANAMQVLVNSGGANTYDWDCSVVVNKVI